MISVGQKLRSERERKGLSLGHIATQTRIGERYLEAIEADDLSRLPGGFFYRSFVRQYAGALGLEAQELETQLERVMPAPAPVVPDAVLHQHPPIRDLHPILSEERAVSERGPLGIQIIMLVLVIVACAGLYAWWDQIKRSTSAAPPIEKAEKSQSPAPKAVEPAPAPAPVPSTPAAEAPAPSSPAAEAPVPVAPKPKQPAATSAPAPAPAAPTTPAATPTAPSPGSHTVALSSTEDVWVSLRSDGKTLFVGTIQPSQPRTFEAGEHANLLVGNAANLDVRWDGKPVGTIGPRGQVRKVLLAPEKVDIVDPKKEQEPEP